MRTSKNPINEFLARSARSLLMFFANRGQTMEVLQMTDGQGGLPRYFGQVFRVTKTLKNGRLDFVLADGRRFRAEGKNPGPVADIQVHDPVIFARLIREG